MKAKSLYGEFNLIKENACTLERFVETMQTLQTTDSLHTRIQSITFPVEILYSISPTARTVFFYSPENKWTADECRECLTALREAFSIHMFKKTFSSTLGTYTWVGEIDNFTIYVNDAFKAPECKIVEYQETVTRYKSVCEGQEGEE